PVESGVAVVFRIPCVLRNCNQSGAWRIYVIDILLRRVHDTPWIVTQTRTLYTWDPQPHSAGGDLMALTLAEANRMIQAAIAKAEELQVKISVAVCDTGGNLIAFNRMNGAIVVSATVAQGKAAASAGFGRASGALQADSPVIQAVIASLGGR